MGHLRPTALFGCCERAAVHVGVGQTRPSADRRRSAAFASLSWRKRCAPQIESCISTGRTSSSAIAAGLNARGIAVLKGGQWFPMQVRRVRDRLGL
jgi:hypothetical protein